MEEIDDYRARIEKQRTPRRKNESRRKKDAKVERLFDDPACFDVLFALIGIGIIVTFIFLGQ